jgi:hypothetical protein
MTHIHMVLINTRRSSLKLRGENMPSGVIIDDGAIS